MEPVGTMNSEHSEVADALDRLRRGAVESCVLAVLAAGPAYAHDIVRRLAGIEGMVTSEGTVYPMLSRLRRAGLVHTQWQESPTGPPRRYYQLTADGQRAVAAFAEAWLTFRAGVDTLVASTTAPAPASTTAAPDPTVTEETR